VATQVLEEGVDVPSCHLVIRFDLPATARGFIQSRGRARMPNSDYVLLVRRHVFQFCCYFFVSSASFIELVHLHRI
jgi:endoribonuclease Dicer